MYKSPIEIIYGQLNNKIDGEILRVVQSYSINVDKAELLRALQYDRKQYEKGYSEGYAAARKIGQWIGEGDGYADGELVFDVWYCSECNYCIDDGTDDPALLPNFCPECGSMNKPDKISSLLQDDQSGIIQSVE